MQERYIRDGRQRRVQMPQIVQISLPQSHHFREFLRNLFRESVRFIGGQGKTTRPRGWETTGILLSFSFSNSLPFLSILS